MREHRRPIHLMAATRLAASENHLLDLAAAARLCQVEPILVGGALRDVLLGRQPRDLDLILCGETAVSETFLATWAAGHGSRVLKFDRRGLRERRIVLPRREMDFVLVPPGTLKKELARRDFTINALALPLFTPHLLDLFGGCEDLAAGTLRPISPTSLDADPLRALRAIRLLAEGIATHLDPDTELQMRRVAGRLTTCAAERIGMEMDRITASGSLAPALRRMSEMELLAAVVPEALRAKGVTQNAYHHLDVWEHTVEALSLADPIAHLCQGLVPPAGAKVEIPAGEDLLVLRYALLFHDLGKPATRSTGSDGRVHFYGHEKMAAALAADFCRRHSFSRRRSSRIGRLARLHLRPGALGPAPTRRALRRLLHEAGSDLQLLLLLSLADTGATRGPASRGNVTLLVRNCDSLLALSQALGEEIRRPEPLLDGRQVMDLLGLAPGPAVGRYLKLLLVLQVEGTVSTRKEATTALFRLAGQQND